MNQRDITYAKWTGLAACIFVILGAVLEYWPTQSPLQWHNLAEAKDLAASQNKPIFVDVYAEWCGPCKQMDKTVFPDDSVKWFLTTHFIPAKVNGDDPVRGDSLRKQFGIRAYPTYIILSPVGKERKRTVGYLAKENMVKWLSDSVGVQILQWPDLDKAVAIARLQHRRVMVLVLQSGEEIEQANAMFEEKEVIEMIGRMYVPTLLVRGNVGEDVLLQRVGASPKVGMGEVIVLTDDQKETGRFFITPQMEFSRLAIAMKLSELATK